MRQVANCFHGETSPDSFLGDKLNAKIETEMKRLENGQTIHQSKSSIRRWFITTERKIRVKKDIREREHARVRMNRSINNVCDENEGEKINDSVMLINRDGGEGYVRVV